MPKACEDCKSKKIISITPFKNEDGLSTNYYMSPCESNSANVEYERLTYCIKRYHKKIRDAIEKEVK